jgi:hypothetical protein
MRLTLTRLFVALSVLAAATSAGLPINAQELQDVVYLHDGSVIRGVIVEQVPGESILIETVDGNRFRYQMDQIQRMTREPSVGGPLNPPPPQAPVLLQSPKSPGTATVLSLLIVGAGQAYNGDWGKGLAFLGGAVLLGSAAISEANSDACYYDDECGTAGALALGWLAVSVWSIVDAYQGAQAFNERLGIAGLELLPEPDVRVAETPGGDRVAFDLPLVRWRY